MWTPITCRATVCQHRLTRSTQLLNIWRKQSLLSPEFTRTFEDTTDSIIFTRFSLLFVYWAVTDLWGRMTRGIFAPVRPCVIEDYTYIATSSPESRYPWVTEGFEKADGIAARHWWNNRHKVKNVSYFSPDATTVKINYCGTHFRCRSAWREATTGNTSRSQAKCKAPSATHLDSK